MSKHEMKYKEEDIVQIMYIDWHDKAIESHRQCCQFYEATCNNRMCRFKLGEKRCNNNCVYMKKFIKLIKTK